ncbi:Six-hairpin glycosidase-like protein [Aspergillus cavernicola]|uniref:Six-hairpin glycosidase-like protein n=1 Tax=Aspergillus cavernicola TaxID=176166 RepID=A0ABR4HCY6_9EURO
MGSITPSATGNDSVNTQVLLELFSENVFAKSLRVAIEALENNNPPTAYPEFVPQTGEDEGRYFLRDADFWTCGFFPGILYLLRERAVRYPQVFPYLGHETSKISPWNASLRRQLASLSHSWTLPIQAMMSRTDTHDMGFILQPSLQMDWELTSNDNSLQAILTGARSLASRYVPGVGAIRSWDALIQTDVSITSLTDDCVVIIDSMMNLDLLYYASSHMSDPSLADMATTHARTVMKSLLRPEMATGRKDAICTYPLYSTFHVVNFDPWTGGIKQQRTAQGYRADSTWARGQAWGIAGFAQTYKWTKEKDFLAVACGLAEYFLWRMETAPACVESPASTLGRHGERTIGRYVPLWDFDAPIEDESNPLRDSSAGVIAANGMLLLSQSFRALGDEKLAERYYTAAMRIVTDTIEFCLSQEKARVVQSGESIRVEDVVPGQRFDAILKNATANHNSKEYNSTRYSDHGLVYADYYLLEFGNQLLRMGLV